MTAPAQSLQQRLAALERANDVRIYRARWKRDVKDLSKRAGVAEVAWQIADPHPLADTMKIGDLLMCCPTIGRVKRNRILLAAKVSPSRSIGGLTERQRLEIICQLSTLTHEEEALIRKLKVMAP